MILLFHRGFHCRQKVSFFKHLSNRATVEVLSQPLADVPPIQFAFFWGGELKTNDRML
jgi:hypothetical protein